MSDESILSRCNGSNWEETGSASGAGRSFGDGHDTVKGEGRQSSRCRRCCRRAAVERGAPGIYNIVDDDPAPVAEWLPAPARVIGAKPPLRLPVWLGRLAIGGHGVVMMTDVRRASNGKAKLELHWRPQWASWRDGFKSVLSDAGEPAHAPRPEMLAS